MGYFKPMFPRGERRVSMPPIPRIFWCYSYLDKKTGEVIPDGNDCCFNHYIGLPTREKIKGKEETKVRHPLYDFQEEILRNIEVDNEDDGKRYHAIMKSPKLGFTEFWIRFALWKCLVDPIWEDGQVSIVNATRQSESNYILKRMKDLLDNEFHKIPYGEDNNTKSSFTVNKTDIFAFPSGNIDSIRSKPNARMVLIDESAFFKFLDKQDQKVKDAAEHYFGSLDYYLIFISTAGDRAAGFFYDLIEGDPDPRYHIYKFTNPDKYGLKPHPESGTSMYNKKLIDSARQTREYRRNYLGEWGSGADTIFDHKDIRLITQKYRILNPGNFPSALGVDPAYGRGTTRAGSRFGMMGIYKKDGIMYTDFEKEMKGISESEGRTAILRAMKRGYETVVVDSHYQGLIRDLQGAGLHVKQVNFSMAQSKGPGRNLEAVMGEQEARYMESLNMIDTFERIVSQHKIRIHPTHTKLIHQLMTIQKNDKGLPAKTHSRFDVGDAAQMAVYYLDKYDAYGIV